MGNGEDKSVGGAVCVRESPSRTPSPTPTHAHGRAAACCYSRGGRLERGGGAFMPAIWPLGVRRRGLPRPPGPPPGPMICPPMSPRPPPPPPDAGPYMAACWDGMGSGGRRKLCVSDTCMYACMHDGRRKAVALAASSIEIIRSLRSIDRTRLCVCTDGWMDGCRGRHAALPKRQAGVLVLLIVAFARVCRFASPPSLLLAGLRVWVVGCR